MSGSLNPLSSAPTRRGLVGRGLTGGWLVLNLSFVTRVDVRELQRHLGRYLDAVEAGEILEVRRHRRVIARVVPTLPTSQPSRGRTSCNALRCYTRKDRLPSLLPSDSTATATASTAVPPPEGDPWSHDPVSAVRRKPAGGGRRSRLRLGCPAASWPTPTWRRPMSTRCWRATARTPWPPCTAPCPFHRLLVQGVTVVTHPADDIAFPTIPAGLGGSSRPGSGCSSAAGAIPFVDSGEWQG